MINAYETDTDRYKLLPTQGDRPAYQQIILNSPNQSPSHFLECYKFFERKIRQNNSDLTNLLRVIINHLSIVSIVLSSDDNPHLVFESLNAKGRPLTQADLIRNYFFMRIHIDQQDAVYSEYWEPMQCSLSTNLTECIRHYLMKDGTVINQNDVYFALKEEIGSNDALDYLKDLAKFANYYWKLISPEQEQNRKIAHALSRLNRLEVTTAYPFLLNCYHDYAENQISAEQLLEILQVIENFIIRRFICNVPTYGLNKIFPAIYSQIRIRNYESIIHGLKDLLQSRSYPKDHEFQNQFIDIKLYGAGERLQKTKLILEAIEESYGHKEIVSLTNLTIEHIMPQTLTEEWQEHLGEDWVITHELRLHTIGNLTLTGYNSELSNEDFLTEKERLLESHLELNKYFENQYEWKKENIDNRSTYLSESALRIWPYFGSEKNPDPSGDSVIGRTPKLLRMLDIESPVKSWRDVMETTANILISQLEPEQFEQIVQQYPRFIAPTKDGFRSHRKLVNGLYIEVNLSARDIDSFCKRLVESAELTFADWEVEVD